MIILFWIHRQYLVTDGIIISQYTGVNLIVARHAKTQMKELELTLNRFEQLEPK
jgi:tyrosine-protein kinase Etk/Wzc